MTGDTEARLAHIEAVLGIGPAASDAPPLLTAIVATTATVFSVPVGSIRGTARDREAIRARFAAIWAIHHALPDLSLRQIGQALGRRDHTSILHAIRRAEEWRNGDETFRMAIDRISNDAVERVKG